MRRLGHHYDRLLRRLQVISPIPEPWTSRSAARPPPSSFPRVPVRQSARVPETMLCIRGDGPMLMCVSIDRINTSQSWGMARGPQPSRIDDVRSIDRKAALRGDARIVQHSRSPHHQLRQGRCDVIRRSSRGFPSGARDAIGQSRARTSAAPATSSASGTGSSNPSAAACTGSWRASDRCARCLGSSGLQHAWLARAGHRVCPLVDFANRDYPAGHAMPCPAKACWWQAATNPRLCWAAVRPGCRPHEAGARSSPPSALNGYAAVCHRQSLARHAMACLGG